MAVLLTAPTKNAIQKTLDAQLLSTAGSGDPITLSDVDGIANLPGVCVIRRIDANGGTTPEFREYIEYSGTSGSTLLITTRNVDSSNAALTHPVGSIVEFIPDVTWADRIYDALANVVNVSTLALDTAKVVTPTGTQTLTNKSIVGGFMTGATLTGVTLVNAVGASGMSDGGSFVYPSQFETIRAFSSNASVSSTSYTEMEANASLSILKSGHGDIVLTPGSNKLVRTAVLRQNNTTNTYKPNTVILTGWGFIEGNGSGLISETVTFGITFSATPIVIIGIAGARTSTPTNLEDLDLNPQAAANVHNASQYAISTTGFTAAIARQSGNLAAGTYFGYTWMAIGEV